MKSPFPGMDPYLESPTHWSDFHAHFIIALADSINGFLPDNYVARIGEHVMVVTPAMVPPEEQARVPDVTVMREPAASAEGAWGGGVAAAAWPAVTLENVQFVDDYTETFIEIQRLPEREVVTVVELFSPTNKYGEGRGIYMQKRREFLRQPINIVELDLLRAGARLQFTSPLPAGHYYAFVSRANNRLRTEVCGWRVRSPFPVIPVPLRQPERDVRVDINEPFAAAYGRGRYWKLIDYADAPPPPAFARADVDWVSETARPGAQPS